MPPWSTRATPVSRQSPTISRGPAILVVCQGLSATKPTSFRPRDGALQLSPFQKSTTAHHNFRFQKRLVVVQLGIICSCFSRLLIPFFFETLYHRGYPALRKLASHNSICICDEKHCRAQNFSNLSYVVRWVIQHYDVFVLTFIVNH